MARLIVVSNRVSMPSSGGAPRAGGLEVALAPVLKNIPSVWFGWSGNVVDADKVATQRIEQGRHTYVVTDLSEEDYQEYYNGFANRVLWPVLHYRHRPDRVHPARPDRLFQGEPAFRPRALQDPRTR